MASPGSESIQFDMEKLFLPSVSKENLDLRGKIQKNLPYKTYKSLYRSNRLIPYAQTLIPVRLIVVKQSLSLLHKSFPRRLIGMAAIGIESYRRPGAF